MIRFIQCGPCTDINPETYLRGFGDIKYIKTEVKDANLLNFYDFVESKDREEIESLRDKAIEYSGKLASFVIKPYEVGNIEESGFWVFKKYRFKLLYVNYMYSLLRFSRDNLKANPLIPEILILYCLSCATHAILALKRMGIKHLNISPETIYVNPFGQWLICPPKADKITLSTRAINNKKADKNNDKDSFDFVQYLIPKEIDKGEGQYDPWNADIFSLAISVLHSVYPFKLSFLETHLEQEDIDKKIKYISDYYSSSLYNVFKKMAVVDVNERIAVEDLAVFLEQIANPK